MASCNNEFNTLTEAQLLSFYCNAELEIVEDYIEQFLKETIFPPVNDEFYRTVLQYKESCFKTDQFLCERKQLENKIQALYPTVWTHRQNTISQIGECNEGKKASGSCTVTFSEFNWTAALELKTLHESLTALHTSKSAKADMDYHFSKMKCELAVELAVKSFMEHYQLRPDYPCYVKFHPAENDLNCRHRENLKRNCTILFFFLREAGLHQDFVCNAKLWLQNM
uniref:Uncharacterized protein n=1 Tax=Romanomermis culicivorax TaxID=13658 RepID=A0A915J6W1_ROMCU